MKKAIKTFKALSDPTRLRILMLLLQQDLCVCELLFILKMEQSRISHQLRILRDAELVEDIREGKWIIYRIPKSERNKLELIFKASFDGRLARSKEIQRDKKNLDLCLKKQIRKQSLST